MLHSDGTNNHPIKYDLKPKYTEQLTQEQLLQLHKITKLATTAVLSD